MQADRNQDTDAHDAEMLARYHEEGCSGMTTLNVRAALHAAERTGDKFAARELAGFIDLRESRGDTA